jgi:hypothetical protein
MDREAKEEFLSGSETFFEPNEPLRVVTYQGEKVANFLMMERFKSSNTVLEPLHVALNAADPPLVQQNADQNHERRNHDHG